MHTLYLRARIAQIVMCKGYQRRINCCCCSDDDTTYVNEEGKRLSDENNRNKNRTNISAQGNIFTPRIVDKMNVCMMMMKKRREK